MMMPVMGGLDFMRNLKAARSALPDIIVFSNISAPQQVDAVMGMGAKAYWIKSDYTPDMAVTELAKLWKAKTGGAAEA
jgi:CheY-like chemotaxis protein